jgi:hypothetical protein
MKFTKKWTGLILLIFLLVACGQAQESRDTANSGASAPVFEQPMEEESGAGESVAAQDGQVQEQLIIRAGEVDIVVEDTEAAIDEIARRAAAAGGWVVSSNVFQTGEAKSGSLTIRVPVDQFDEIMNQIESMALELINSSTSGDDVTEEFVDRQARLENLEATAARVRSFLEEADNVEEALAVNAELSHLEGEIEAIRGRIQYLEQSAAFSTISVRITPDALSQPIEVGGWRPAGVTRDAVEALITALQGLATIAIWIVVVLLPLALLVLIPIWVIYQIIRRRRRASSSPVAEG